MKKISVVFANKLDEQFLLEYAQLTSELFNRKIEYNEILLAKVDEKTVGFLIFEYLWSHNPFMAQIWINSDYRNKGIGKSILIYFEQYLSENNHTILLCSAMENNKNAQAWHMRMGFKDCGTIAEINDDNTGEVFF